MAFLPRHACRIPILGRIIRHNERQYERSSGQRLDYGRAWWTPPLPAADAYRLESRQMEALGLTPLVSLSDHDSIEAGNELRLAGITAPVSVEWSVPYGASFLHIGVHNLPPEHARDWMRLFAHWTARPDSAILGDILAGLDAMPGVLTIVNHPFWDEGGIGPDGQLALVKEFVGNFHPFLHALELNGLRSWQENQKVIALASAVGLPLVSGGDRHGCEPNANINLTNARTFSEFAAEIRGDRRSQVLFLPQYREPQNVRCAETIWDALHEYPEYPGRALWSDRIFFQDRNNVVHSLTNLWRGAGPAVVRNFIQAMRVFQRQSVRNALRLAFAEREFQNPREEAAG